MNTEISHSEGLVTKPFEAKVASCELRIRVEYFKKLLSQKRVKKTIRKIKPRSVINE